MARFTDIFDDVTKQGRKIPTNEYLERGMHPIIDQGQKEIAGYSNEEAGLFCDVPAIIFGDHTRVIKYVDTPCFLGADGVKLLKAKKSNANYKYLFYALSSADIPNTGYNRHFKWLKEVEIPTHTENEQNDIVAVLDKVSGLIALRKQQLAKLDELVKARFVELFGSVEDNVFGLKTIKIKDACDLINGKAFKPEDWSDTGLPIVRIQNLNNEQAPFNYFDGEIKEQYLIDTGELLFSWSGTPGTSFGAFFWNRGKAVLNQHIFRVRPKVEFNLLFLQFALNGRIDYIISKAHGGVGLQHITKKELDEVELLLPSVDIQNQFAAFVKQTGKSKLAAQQSLDKLELLKKSLMQKYFG